ncbi:Homeodomain-like protein [Chlamydoabsidia padenii]|nr:Homeodomain-like protein [Chlamydoabsidia padenii]
MLNHEKKDTYFYDNMLTSPRSAMLDITNLLCHDDDEPITPCLSAPLSPCWESSSIPSTPPLDISSFDENVSRHRSQTDSKIKRKRATKKQLQVLHRVFEHTFFPSTQVRAQLGRQLGMNPRTVQIWFQNRRQALRTREKQRHA